MMRVWKTVVGVLAVLVSVAACGSGGDSGSSGSVTRPPLPSNSATSAPPAAPTTGSGATAPAAPNAAGTPGSPDVAAASQEAWLGQVCTAITPAARFNGQLPELDPTDLAGSRDRLVAYLVSRQQALQAAYNGISTAGYPPVPGGEQAEAGARTAVQNRIGTLQSSAEQLRSAPTSPAAISGAAASAKTLAAQLSGPALTVADLGLPQQLQDTARTVPACQAIGVS